LLLFFKRKNGNFAEYRLFGFVPVGCLSVGVLRREYSFAAFLQEVFLGVGCAVYGNFAKKHTDCGSAGYGFLLLLCFYNDGLIYIEKKKSGVTIGKPLPYFFGRYSVGMH